MAKATVVGDEFVDGLISDLNKQLGEVAYNLAGGTSPTEVNTFVSSGSVLLDTILANRRNGGFPVGRISEIVGEEATGKSLIALHALKNTQKQGGVAILIDTENATSVDLLKNIGIDVSRMMYMQLGTVEEVFEAMERIIKRIREKGDNRLVTIVWDSVAATSTKAEVEGEYGDYTIGLAARLIAQGLRKITQFIGKMNVCLIFCNQMKVKIGVMFGDPMTTPGGKAIPYHASTRLRLYRNGELKSGKTIQGVGVKAKTIKNKLGPPLRQVEFDVIFGKGIDDETAWIKVLEAGGIVQRAGAWYKFMYEGEEIKFQSKNWKSLLTRTEGLHEWAKSKVEDSLVIDVRDELETLQEAKNFEL